ACLYKGVEDTHEILTGPLSETDLDALYRGSATFGTTLQVPNRMWAADRDAFVEYWNDAVSRVSLDDTVREYLRDLIELRFLPAPLRVPFGRLNRFVTTGFLPPRFRAEMRLPWSQLQQRQFERLMRLPALLVQHSPGPVRRFPFNLLLCDLPRRVSSG